MLFKITASNCVRLQFIGSFWVTPGRSNHSYCTPDKSHASKTKWKIFTKPNFFATEGCLRRITSTDAILSTSKGMLLFRDRVYWVLMALSLAEMEFYNLILYSMFLLLLSTCLDLWKDASLTLRNVNFYSDQNSKQLVV